MASRIVSLVVNDRPREFIAPPGCSLLSGLRDSLGLTAAKRGCGQGSCGTCTVLVDGRPVVSCLVALETVEGASVRTLEGVARGGELDEVQSAFLEGFATQCGFCTSGMIMTAEALIEHNPDPGTDDVVEAISGNVCRCTGYGAIVTAILDAARRRRGDPPDAPPGTPAGTDAPREARVR
jgi:carbon-monoxide dehydrogenase small subunit